MSLLDRMKNFFNRNRTDELNNIQPLMDYDEAKIVLDNMGGLSYCLAQKKKGRTQKEVAKELNIKQPAVSRYCKEQGCKWTNLNKAPSQEAQPVKVTKKNRIKKLEELGGYDYIIQQKELGKTYAQISVELGQSPDDNWISNYMRYRGYKTKQIKLTGEFDLIDDAGGILFLKCELQNKSVRKIADELNIRPKSVYEYLYKKGYDMKTFRNEKIIDIPEGAANWKLYEDWDNEYTLDQFKKAIKLKGTAKTAEALNCTEHTLKLYCALRGLPL